MSSHLQPALGSRLMRSIFKLSSVRKMRQLFDTERCLMSTVYLTCERRVWRRDAEPSANAFYGGVTNLVRLLRAFPFH